MTVSASVSTAKGRVLIVGATGFIGQFVAEASLGAGRPTYVLVRPGPVCGGPSKGSTIRALQDKGATILHVKKNLYFSVTYIYIHANARIYVQIIICIFFFQGLINDKEFMEKILKEHEIDIVISAVGGENILDQLALIEAIKTVGTIKVYIYHYIYIKTVVFPAPYVHFLLIFAKQGAKRPC
jgi:leucoanthocyanidin reductase